MYRPFKIFTALVVAIGMLLTVVPERLGFGVAPAYAQKAKKKRKGIFDILFGSRKRVKKKRVKRKKTSVKRKKKSRKKSKTASKKSKRSTKRRAAVIREPEVEAVEKLEDAKTVLVIGDFFGGGLADGLEKGLVANAQVAVIDKTKASSGFVRTDIINWPERATELITELKPSHVVAMLGSNDRQLMRVEGKRLKKRTPEWDAAYKARLSALGDALKAGGVPFTWVGLPPVRFNSMNTDFLVFNEWYRQAATAAGGDYVDVWDGFSDADGAYTRSGPDVKGQIVLLRGKDGINLTRAGRSRLSYYVQGDIEKRLGGAIAISSIEDLSGLGGSAPKTPEYDPAKSGKTVVILLDDPSTDGGDALAGATPEKPAPNSAAGGVPITRVSTTRKSQPGRVDSFVWPPADDEVPLAGSVATSN